MPAFRETFEIGVRRPFCNVLDPRGIQQRVVFADTDERRDIDVAKHVSVVANRLIEENRALDRRWDTGDFVEHESPHVGRWFGSEHLVDEYLNQFVVIRLCKLH